MNMISTRKKSRASLGHRILLTMVVLLCAGQAMSQPASVADPMRPLAEEYVHLGLLMQNHDKLEYMYFGPQEWRTAAQGNQVTLPQIQADLSSLHDRITALPVPVDAMELQRRKVLLGRISAGIVRADILQGKLPASFDEETRLIFGVEVPHYEEAHFRELAAELDVLIPGEGDLPARLQQFRDQFVIPVDKVEPAIRVALKECRQRTLAHLTLPENESVSLNITTGKHWVGFAEFKGNSRTTIHINKSVPIHVERVLQLGCHEGYPGHHVHATLMVVGYYNIAAASYGLQAGAQEFAYAMFLMTDAARQYIDTSDGWEVGVGPSVVVVDDGVAKTLTTTTAKDDVYTFIFGQKGMMAGLGIQGSKITKINP